MYGVGGRLRLIFLGEFRRGLVMLKAEAVQAETIRGRGCYLDVVSEAGVVEEVPMFSMQSLMG